MSASALLTTIVQQAHAYLIPHGVRTIEPESIGLLNLDDAQAAQTLNAKQVPWDFGYPVLTATVILRESAQQGLITEAGYQEQAQSYGIMASTARQTAAVEEQIADETKSAGLLGGLGSFAGAALKGAAAIAGLAVGGPVGAVAAETAVGFDGGIGSLY